MFIDNMEIAPFYLVKKIAEQAAAWGADQELEACLSWMADRYGNESHAMTLLRAARRPKAPSLKEQALKILDLGHGLADCDRNILRRALEVLPE